MFNLIVIGSHSGRSIFDVLLGGTTAAVVKKAKCPVLVASLPEDAKFNEDIG
ncbi:universal stress protein [candidate division CSSED10-310 bacterium]|uniref:Universal stress protein n=1 Tax=candidate division CSSED10-310 bacterium TaxID=2855610 RepID=A0ABV6YZ98_UNCC1